MESILTSIKKLLGIAEEYEHFDMDLIMHINSVFMILNQIGVGTNNFRIENKDNTWDEFVSDSDNLASVKSYVYLKVKLLFDPPASSTIVECMNRMISEYEYRLNLESEV